MLESKGGSGGCVYDLGYLISQDKKLLLIVSETVGTIGSGNLDYLIPYYLRLRTVLLASNLFNGSDTIYDFLEDNTRNIGKSFSDVDLVSRFYKAGVLRMINFASEGDSKICSILMWNFFIRFQELLDFACH